MTVSTTTFRDRLPTRTATPAPPPIPVSLSHEACQIDLLANRIPSLLTGSTHKVYRDWHFAVVCRAAPDSPESACLPGGSPPKLEDWPATRRTHQGRVIRIARDHGGCMDPETRADMSPAEREMFTAMEERLRQLRRRRGVPNGVTLEEAIALHFLSADEVERARWGDAGPLPLRTDGTTS